jgi:hypothetical protein
MTKGVWLVDGPKVGKEGRMLSEFSPALRSSLSIYLLLDFPSLFFFFNPAYAYRANLLFSRHKPITEKDLAFE